MTDTLFSLVEAAQYAHVTRQAIYLAIRKNKLKAVKEKLKWMVTRRDLDDYRANKYNRDDKKVNGEYLFDMERGFFSVNQISKIISAHLGRPYSKQHLYYKLRTGQLTALRMGVSWIIHKDDAIKLIEKETGSSVRLA